MTAARRPVDQNLVAAFEAAIEQPEQAHEYLGRVVDTIEALVEFTGDMRTRAGVSYTKDARGRRTFAYDRTLRALRECLAEVERVRGGA